MRCETPLTGRTSDPARSPLDLQGVRAGRRLPGAAQGACGMTPADVHGGGQGVEPAGPRRRRLPDRPEVELRAHGRGRAAVPSTSSPTPTRWSRARSRTALLLEGDPHQLIEGMIIARYAIQADVAYIFLRREYPDSRAGRLTRAIAEAHAAGYLGENILGSGFSLELHLHASAGRYMCGEETGLLNALEGQAGQPARQAALSRRSSACGASRPSSTTWRPSATCRTSSTTAPSGSRASSTTEDGGTKLYGASGRVKRPGHCGSCRWARRSARSWRSTPAACGTATGSAAFCPAALRPTSCVEEHLDAPMDFDSLSAGRQPPGHRHDDRPRRQDLPGRHACTTWSTSSRRSRAAGARPAGTGCPGSRRSCAPSRRATASRRTWTYLEMHTRRLRPGNTFCALAPGAMEPLQSALKYFRDDFERHIREKRCPWK